MKYKTIRDIANDIKQKIDSYVAKEISEEQLLAFIQEVMSVSENRRRIYKVDGYAVTLETVLGARMAVFEKQLKQIEKSS